MTSAQARFNPLFPLVVLLLAVLVLAPTPRLWASKEYPTLNELLESGKLDKDLADELQPPEPTDQPASEPGNEEQAEPPTPMTDEEQAPVAPAPPMAADQPPVSTAPIQLADKTVVIGRVPFTSIKGMMATYQGLIAFLRKEMGVKDVRIVIGKDYAGVLNGLNRGVIDFAWVGPMAYVIGREKFPLVPVARAQRRSGATYRGVFITRSDSPILGIEDIKGKVIGFVDPESASGYLYPLYFLHRSKINPHTDCKNVIFLKKHDAVLAAVLSRQIDVGVCLEDTILSITDKKILDQILVLGKTDEVTSDVVACRADCHPTLRDTFRGALLKTRTLKQTVNAVTGLPPVLVFHPLNEEDLDPVRGVLQTIKGVRQP